MNRLLAIATLLLAVAWARPATATPVESVLFERGVHVVGRQASATAVLAVDGPDARQDDPALELHWTRSGIVDPRRSTLSVLVDGRPVLTTWLADAEDHDRRGGLRTRLDGLSGGFHRIDVQVRLAMADDQCVDVFDDDAWLFITAGSHVAWDRRAGPAVDRASFDSLPATLRALPAVTVRAGEIQTDRVPPLLHLDHVLRDWGIVPTYAADSPSAGAIISLGTSDEPRLAWDGKHLSITARSDDELVRLVRRLPSDAFRALCGATTCDVAAGTPMPTDSGPTEPASHSTLADLGYPDGWTAEGAGEHLLRFNQPRPANWRIQTAPVIELALRAPSSALDDRASSVILVVNDRPLATWNPSEWGEGTQHLAVPLPQSMWDDEVWSFELRARLAARDARPCDAARDDTVWLGVEPESVFRTPRTELRGQGIAEFARRAAEERPQLVVPSDLAPTEFEALAAVAYRLHGSAPTLRWHIAGDEPGPRLAVTRGAYMPGDLTLDEHGRWSDETGRRDMPLLRSDGSPLLHVVSEHGLLCLVVRLPEVGAASVPVPPLDRLETDVAVLQQDAWRAIARLDGQAFSEIEVSAPSEVAMSVVSVEQDVARRAHRVWLLVSVAVLSVLILWLALGRREEDVTAATSDHFGIEHLA